MQHKILIFKYKDAYGKKDYLDILVHYEKESECEEIIKMLSVVFDTYAFHSKISIVPEWAINLLKRCHNCLLLNDKKQYVHNDEYFPQLYANELDRHGNLLKIDYVMPFEWIDEELKNLGFKDIEYKHYVYHCDACSMDDFNGYIVNVEG